jgi:xanthine phosphoribosyltransferase
MNYSFEMMQDDIRNILNQMEAVNYRPSIILGITRGGLIPATLIAQRLNVNFVDAIHPKNHDVNLLRKVYEKYIADTVANCKSSTLIVDDIFDTGKTYVYFKKIFPDAKFASLLYNKGCEIKEKPEYIGTTIDKTIDPSWVEFWWEHE